MPFGNVKSPALGITLLKGGLAQRGLPCDIRYLQFPFAAQIGVGVYEMVSACCSSLLLGDWLFTHQLFDEDQLPPVEEYLQVVLGQYDSKIDREMLTEYVQQLPRLREQAGPFLDLCMESVPWREYQVIGFTSTFAQNVAALAMAKRVKEKYPEKIIVFGGANCEGEMGAELHRRFLFVDFVCSGESDWLFPELVQRLRAGTDVSDLEGLVYRRNGETIANGDHAQAIQDMDSLPLPDYDDYFAQLEENGLAFEPGEIHLMAETSRGCWWGAKSHCLFCGLNGPTVMFRSKSAKRALEEFVHLARRYPQTKSVTMTDNILDIHYFQDVVPGLIEANLGLAIWYETKANLNKEKLGMLKKAGIAFIQPGIESLDDGILKLMRKGCTVTQNVQMLKWAREAGVRVWWNLISGFPDEEREAYKRMANLVPSIIHLPPPSSHGVSHLQLCRYSPYFENPESYGMINVRSTEGYHYVYPFPEESLMRLAYYFDFDYADERNSQDYMAVLDAAIKEWHNQGNKGSLLSLSDDERLTLYDTRVGARQHETVLEGVAKIIYEFCDEARNLSSILKHLAERNESLMQQANAKSVQALLDSLVNARVMLCSDGHYLSLAIPMGRRAESFIDSFVDALSSPRLADAPIEPTVVR